MVINHWSTSGLQSLHVPGIPPGQIFEQLLYWGTILGGPNKDYSIWGSIIRSPYFGKLLYLPLCSG